MYEADVIRAVGLSALELQWYAVINGVVTFHTSFQLQNDTNRLPNAAWSGPIFAEPYTVQPGTTSLILRIRPLFEEGIPLDWEVHIGRVSARKVVSS